MATLAFPMHREQSEDRSFQTALFLAALSFSSELSVRSTSRFAKHKPITTLEWSTASGAKILTLFQGRHIVVDVRIRLIVFWHPNIANLGVNLVSTFPSTALPPKALLMKGPRNASPTCLVSSPNSRRKIVSDHSRRCTIPDSQSPYF